MGGYLLHSSQQAKRKGLGTYLLYLPVGSTSGRLYHILVMIHARTKSSMHRGEPSMSIL